MTLTPETDRTWAPGTVGLGRFEHDREVSVDNTAAEPFVAKEMMATVVAKIRLAENDHILQIIVGV